MRTFFLASLCIAVAGLVYPACMDKSTEAEQGKPSKTSAGIHDPSGNKPETHKERKAMNRRVRVVTSLGEIVIELDKEHAPITVDNFLRYAKDGQYNGTIFHRVIPEFMIQGGGFEPGMKEKSTRAPIKNEAANGLKNATGTIAMARTAVLDSATSQFFINCKDNSFLDHRDETAQGFGYAVFGHVVKGMDVVHRIEQVPTGTRGMHQNVPVEDVVIKSVKVE